MQNSDAVYFAINDTPYLRRLYRPYWQLCQQVTGLTVLDFGCGYGWGTALLAQSAIQVTGYDCDRARIAYAAENFSGQPGTPIFTSELSDLLGQKFDVITLFHVLDEKSDIKEIAHTLRTLSGHETRLYLAVKDHFLAPARVLLDALGGGDHLLGTYPSAENQQFSLFELPRIR